MKIQKISDKMISTWNDEVKAVIDTWTSYFVTLQEFKKAVYVKGVDFAKNRGVVAWIVDSSQANGAFLPEIQDFIGSDIFPKFKEIGVKYFITINTSANSLTKLTVKSYSAKVGPNGLQLVEVKSVDDAIMWLKENTEK